MTEYTNCIICGNALTEKQIANGTKTCCRSCSTKLQWQNKDRLASLKEKAKKRWANEDFKKATLQKVSEGIKRKYREDPDYYANTAERMRAFWKEPQNRAKQSETTKKVFENQEYKEYHRKRTSEGTKKAYENPELRHKQSEKLKKIYENPELRQKVSKSLQLTYQNDAKKADILARTAATKRRNHSFNISKPEKYVLQKLQQSFLEVEQQYRSEQYPFNCDFYIPSLDLYIECHFNWTHGGRFFDETNKDCIEQLNAWKEKAKTSKFYRNAIYQWTDLDIRKAKVAKNNNLNWLCFYTIDEFEKWLNEKDSNNASN